MDILESRDYTTVRGIPMIYWFAENWERVDQFQFRPDDIVLASYPKSGTTWMSEILDLILQNGDLEKCQRDAVYKRVIMMEFAHPKHPSPGTEILAGMPSPRLFRTHLPIQLLPKSFWESKCKVIYVARNGKDVAISDYHFSLAQVCRPHPGSWTQYLDNFMLGNVDFGSWYEHVKSWWEKRNELQLLYLFYEDMKEDLKGVIKKLLAFLHKDMEEEVIEKIIHHTSFHIMKNNRMVNYQTVSNNFLDQTISPFMRKGICGDWKNHFTVAQNERFDEEYARKMSGSSLFFHTEI